MQSVQPDRPFYNTFYNRYNDAADRPFYNTLGYGMCYTDGMARLFYNTDAPSRLQVEAHPAAAGAINPQPTTEQVELRIQLVAADAAEVDELQ